MTKKDKILNKIKNEVKEARKEFKEKVITLQKNFQNLGKKIEKGCLRQFLFS